MKTRKKKRGECGFSKRKGNMQNEINNRIGTVIDIARIVGFGSRRCRFRTCILKKDLSK